MKSASKMRQGAQSTNSERCVCGNVSREFAASVTNLYRWSNARLNTHKAERQDAKMSASLMKMASHAIPYAIANATTRRGASIFSRLFPAALILLLSLSATSAWAQVGSAISGQFVTPTGTPASNARVTVCPYTATGLPCSPQATIYSDPALTLPLSQPYGLDQFGNLNVWVTAGSYIVQIQVNLTISYSYVVTAGGSGGGGGGGITSIGASSPVVVTPSPITNTGTVSCPLCIFGSGITNFYALFSGAQQVSTGGLSDVAGIVNSSEPVAINSTGQSAIFFGIQNAAIADVPGNYLGLFGPTAGTPAYGLQVAPVAPPSEGQQLLYHAATLINGAFQAIPFWATPGGGGSGCIVGASGFAQFSNGTGCVSEFIDYGVTQAQTLTLSVPGGDSNRIELDAPEITGTSTGGGIDINAGNVKSLGPGGEGSVWIYGNDEDFGWVLLSYGAGKIIAGEVDECAPGTNPGVCDSTAGQIDINIDGTENFTGNSGGINVSQNGGGIENEGFSLNGYNANSASTVNLSFDPTVQDVDATSGAVTVNLPLASRDDGETYFIKKIDSSGNAVTVTANSGDLIDGAATYPLATQYDWVMLVSTGSHAWDVYSAQGSGGGGGSGTVTSFSTGSWPSWLVPSVANPTTTPTLSVTSSLTLANVAAGASPTGLFDFSGATAFKVPTHAGATAAAPGELIYDSTNGNMHTNYVGTDLIVAGFPSASLPTSGHCAEFIEIGAWWEIADAGAACGGGGGSGTVNSGTSGQVAFYASTGTAVSGETHVTTAQLGSGTAAAGSYVDGASGAWTVLPFKSLTTTGTSGAATLTSGVLNVPQYTGGGASYTNVVASSTADTTVAAINAKCTGGQTYWASVPISIATGGTIASGCNVMFVIGGVWTIAGGQTVTFANPIQENDGPSSHFTGSGVVSLPAQDARPEWFGAVGYTTETTATTGGSCTTNSTSAIQSTITAMTTGQVLLQPLVYCVNSALSIGKSAVGIHGSQYGFQAQGGYTEALAGGSMIITTSASADIVDAAGADSTHLLQWNKFDYFSLTRGVTPSGTATGLSLSFVAGATVDHVIVADSMRGFYCQFCPANGSGIIQNSGVWWDFNGISESGLTMYGFYLDGSSFAENSIRLQNLIEDNGNGATSNTTYGIYEIGALNDVKITDNETENLSYGMYADHTVDGSISSSDISWINPLMNDCVVSCLYVTGLDLNGDPSMKIIGAWTSTSGSGTPHNVDIINSGGVQVIGGHFTQHDFTNATIGINISGGRNNSLIGNWLNNTSDGCMITISGSNDNLVTGNHIHIENGAFAATVVDVCLTGSSSLNAFSGNLLDGFALQGMNFGGSTANNTLDNTNNIDPTNIATPIVDTGTNNRNLSVNALTANSMIDLGLTASTSPICPNGAGGAFTTVGCSGGGGGSAFSAITSGTNTSAAMVVGSGSSLTVSGSGTNNATSIGGVAVTGTPSVGFVPTATSGSAATWQAASGGGGGGGTSGWSGAPISLLVSATQYVPWVGGGSTSTTESLVQNKAPAAFSIANLQLSLSASLGTGTTLAVTLRDGGASEALTCTTASGGTTCTDTTHTFSVAQGDLLDFVITATGTVTAATPEIILSYTIGVPATSAGGGSTESHTAIGSAELDFTTCIAGGTDNNYTVYVTNLIPGTSGAAPLLEFSTNGGSTWDTSSVYSWAQGNVQVGGGTTGNNTAASVGGILLFGVNNTSGPSATGVSLSGTMTLQNPGGGQAIKTVGLHDGTANYGASSYAFYMSGMYANSSPVNAFRIVYSTGNITSGTVACYAVPN